MPWCDLPEAMLYLGCLCVPGVASSVCLGVKMAGGYPPSVDYSEGQMTHDRAGTQTTHRDAQVLGAGRSVAVCFPSDVKLRVSLCTCSVSLGAKV